MSRKNSTDNDAQKKLNPRAKTGETKKTKVTKSKVSSEAKQTKKVVTKSHSAEPGVNKKVTTSKKAGRQKPKQTTQKNKPATQTKKTEQRLAPEAVESASTHPAASNGRGLAWGALLCSVLALAAGGYAAYQASLNRQVTGSQVSSFDDRLKLVVSDQQSLKSGFASLEQKSGALGDAVETQVKKITDDLTVIQSTVSTLQLASDQSIEAVKENLGASVARWQLDELHSLLSQVNQYYQFTGDKNRALEGLQLAQAKLATIKNPHIAQVGAALAEDVTRLEADPMVDVVALNNRLAGVASLIPELNFILDKKEEQPTPASTDETPKTAQTESGDKSILAVGKALLGDIGNLVQHKKRDAPLKPSLDDNARFVLYESLRLKIQTAMAAMLRHDNAVFQSQLQQANAALNAHFDLQEPKAQTVKNELEAMQALDVSKNTQAISKALTALNSVMVLEK